MVLCSNDAKFCYNRIAYSIASIVLQHLGLSIKPIISILLTIEEIDYYIRTAYSNSSSKL